MSTDRDNDWIDGLAGRGVDPASPAHAEGSALRRMLQAHLVQQANAERATTASIASPDPMRERALIERARREGLLGARTTWRPMLIAAGIAMLAIGIVWETFMRPEAVVVREGAARPAQLQSRDPAALKRQIIDELRAAGVVATGYEALDVQGIDADLPQPLTPEVRSVLAKHDIPVPRDGVLRIEIRESP
jgi:hypothetical protein